MRVWKDKPGIPGLHLFQADGASKFTDRGLPLSTHLEVVPADFGNHPEEPNLLLYLSKLNLSATILDAHRIQTTQEVLFREAVSPPRGLLSSRPPGARSLREQGGVIALPPTSSAPDCPIPKLFLN